MADNKKTTENPLSQSKWPDEDCLRAFQDQRLQETAKAHGIPIGESAPGHTKPQP